MTNENMRNDNSPSDPRFKELTNGYFYTFKEKNDLGKFTGGEGRRYISMDKPFECSYQKTNIQGQRQEKISHDHGSDWQGKDEEQIPLLREDRTNEDGERKEILYQAQKWGITLTQIRAIMQNIERRCEKEGWEGKYTGNPLTPETVTMYDIKDKIIMPFTEERGKKSFVETLPSTKGPQLPRHYLSYTWSAPFKDIVLMLEQFVEDFSRNYSNITDEQGGGMTDETPIHISVFAINQHDLDRAGGVLPFSEFSSGIAQILKLVNYRLITHLDKDGRILERVWPTYDIFVTLMKSGRAGSWKIYITHKHEGGDGNERNAVGLVPGGAPSDKFLFDGAPSDKYSIDTALREKSFPIDLIERFIKYEVKDVKAYEDSDRKNFLNFLADENMDDLDRDPPTEHLRYATFQDAFRANFATPGTLQAALFHGDIYWKQMLDVMSKSTAELSIRFNFESGKGWDELTNSQAKELIHNLPKTTLRLKIFHASYGTCFVKELSDWIKETTNLKTLRIEDSLINCGIIDGQHKVIKELAKSLASCGSLKRLEVWNSNMEENSIFVEIVKTLISNEIIAEALFIKPFNSLYAGDYPTFNKIKCLQTVFVSTGRQVSVLPREIKRATIDWAQDLPKSDKADLLQSGAGPFLKTILNEKFSDKLNLSYIILNVIVQIVIVILLAYYTNVETANHIPNTIIFGLIFCIVWLCIIEVTQISISTVKDYISGVQNWVDLAQLVFLTKITFIPDWWRYHWIEYAIFVSYLSLIFSLSNISFSLAQFVDAIIEIIKELSPFMLTTVLIVLAFTHMFRVRYSEEICPIDKNEFGDPDDLGFISSWTCNSLFRSFKNMFFMFLTDGGWYFDDVRSEGLMVLFALVIGILLLNIVIAVVSNKFTDVQNDAEKVYWVRRLSLIKEVDSLRGFLRRFSKKLFRFNSGSPSGCLLHSSPSPPPPPQSTPSNTTTQPPNSAEHPNVRLSETVVRSLLVERAKRGNRHRKKRFSFNVIPSDDDGYADKKDIKLFFGWWFSPAGWSHPPRLSERIYMFYSYSNWEDIVLPGKVFERILLSCKYNEDLEENWAVVYVAKYFLVKLLTWVVFFIHGIFILAIFIVGFASLGLLWPRSLIERLFHRGVDKESESNSLNVKKFIEELNTKVDTLTALVNDTEDERFVKINTAVEGLSAKVDTLTTLIGNLEKSLQNITPTTTPQSCSSAPPQAYSSQS